MVAIKLIHFVFCLHFLEFTVQMLTSGKLADKTLGPWQPELTFNHQGAVWARSPQVSLSPPASPCPSHVAAASSFSNLLRKPPCNSPLPLHPTGHIHRAPAMGPALRVSSRTQSLMRTFSAAFTPITSSSRTDIPDSHHPLPPSPAQCDTAPSALPILHPPPG